MMATQVVTVSPDTQIGDAARRMVEADVGAAIVLADGDELVGMITERDLLRCVSEGVDPAVPVSDRMTRHVRAMHRQVRGRIRKPAGSYAAGTSYRADQPDLLMWVLFTLVDSALVVYQLYVERLSEDEQEAYWADYKQVGRLFGLRDRDMPASIADLRDYKRAMLEGDALHVSDWARRRAREIVLAPPVPRVARPLLETVNFITIALLPDRIRGEYGFSPLPPAAVRRALVAGGAEYVKRAVIPLMPDRLRLVPAARAAAA